MKRFGIRVSIDGDSTWRAPHLLGESWESFRWFDTRSERDRVFEDMSSPLENYRRGDIPRQVLERVERQFAWSIAAHGELLMDALTLVIGNKNYSSWSLRPWYLMRQAEIAFQEIRLSLGTQAFRGEIVKFNAAGRVPVLCHGDLFIADSLSIAEYLAEVFAEYALWPKDRVTRALARSACAEMHASFSALREAMPMNCRAEGRRVTIEGAVAEDIDRIRAIWRECRSHHGTGGPWLFGAFSIADAFYAPVASRFRTYGVPCGEVEATYVDWVLSQPAMRDWYASAAAEPETIEHEERGKP